MYLVQLCPEIQAGLCPKKVENDKFFWEKVLQPTFLLLFWFNEFLAVSLKEREEAVALDSRMGNIRTKEKFELL